jgi:phage terminase large subunit-like protein
MGQTLFDLLNGRNLRIYKSDELRTQALNTVATESSRGFRISKEKASNKIDSIIALAMACVSAQDYVSKYGMPPSASDPPARKIKTNLSFDPRRLGGHY